MTNPPLVEEVALATVTRPRERSTDRFRGLVTELRPSSTSEAVANLRAVTSVVLPVVETGPEALLRMSELTVSDDGEFRGSMPVGPWLEVEGRTPAGAVAVLVDDLLGYAIVADLPRGHWSVSAEITLDVLRPLPTSGRVFANARLVHADALGGYATGHGHRRGRPAARVDEPAGSVPRRPRRASSRRVPGAARRRPATSSGCWPPAPTSR